MTVKTDAVPWGWQPIDLLCNCQLGPCGHCQNGQHKKCPSERHVRRFITADTHIRDAAGRRLSPVVAVYQVGYPCFWVCPCQRQGHPEFNRRGVGIQLPPIRRTTWRGGVQEVLW